MKNILISVLVILLISTLLISCNDKNNSNNSNADESNISEEIVTYTARELLAAAVDANGADNILIYSTETGDEEIDDFLLEDLYNSLEVDFEKTKVEDISLFQSTAQEVNEVHIIKPKSKNDNADVKTYFQNRIEKLKTVYGVYSAEQAAFASQGKIVEHNDFVFLVMTQGKNDAVIKAIKDKIDGK